MGLTRLQPGSCCGCGSTVCVVQCGTVPVYGAVVTVLSGTTVIATCTTGTGGCCSLSVSGTYTLRVTVSGTVVYNATRTLGGTITVPISDTNTVCCGSYATPHNLTLTDAAGSLPFSFIAGSSPYQWTGCITVTRSAMIADTSLGFCSPGAVGSNPILICYNMVCNSPSTPSFTVTRSWTWMYDNSGIAHWLSYSGFFVPNCSGGLSSTCNPLLPCGQSSNPDTAVFSANPSSSAPFLLTGSPVASSFDYTGDPVGGSVTVSA